MLRLAHEVGRHAVRIGGLVGDDHRLGGPGDDVDADPAEELTLGLCDVGVAGSDDHVGGGAGEEAEGEGADRLDPAETQHDVCAGEVGREQDGGVDAAPVGSGR